MIARSVVPTPATSELYGASHGVSECVAPGGDSGDVALGAAPPLRAHPRTSLMIRHFFGGTGGSNLLHCKKHVCFFIVAAHG